MRQNRRTLVRDAFGGWHPRDEIGLSKSLCYELN